MQFLEIHNARNRSGGKLTGAEAEYKVLEGSGFLD